MADDLVERLRGEIERRRDASGDMLHRGAPDTALTEAADAIESLRAENARLTEEMDALVEGLGDQIADAVEVRIATEFKGFWAREDLVDEIPGMIREAARAILAHPEAGGDHG